MFCASDSVGAGSAVDGNVTVTTRDVIRRALSKKRKNINILNHFAGLQEVCYNGALKIKSTADALVLQLQNPSWKRASCSSTSAGLPFDTPELSDHQSWYGMFRHAGRRQELKRLMLEDPRCRGAAVQERLQNSSVKRRGCCHIPSETPPNHGKHTAAGNRYRAWGTCPSGRPCLGRRIFRVEGWQTPEATGLNHP
jgi:hypothetical protein